MPEEIQQKFLRMIPGLENVDMIQPGTVDHIVLNMDIVHAFIKTIFFNFYIINNKDMVWNMIMWIQEN